jgi:hypothetical protein
MRYLLFSLCFLLTACEYSLPRESVRDAWKNAKPKWFSVGDKQIVDDCTVQFWKVYFPNNTDVENMTIATAKCAKAESVVSSKRLDRTGGQQLEIVQQLSSGDNVLAQYPSLEGLSPAMLEQRYYATKLYIASIEQEIAKSKMANVATPAVASSEPASAASSVVSSAASASSPMLKASSSSTVALPPVVSASSVVVKAIENAKPKVSAVASGGVVKTIEKPKPKPAAKPPATVASSPVSPPSASLPASSASATSISN